MESDHVTGHDHPSDGHAKKRNDPAEMEAGFFQDNRNNRRVVEQSGFREVLPFGIFPRTVHEIAQDQQANISQHQTGENFVGIIPGF